MARLLMVVRPSKGGAFGHAVRLGRAFAERGHQVAVCGPHGARRNDIGIELLELEIGREISLTRHTASTIGLARIVHRFKPDLIHAHGSQGGAITRLARPLNPRVPVVFSPHNFAFTNWFTSSRKRATYRAIERSLAPLTSRFIAVCGAELREVERIAGHRRARLVYNGIEPFDPPPRRPTEAAGPTMVAVTELQPPKGVPTLIEAMPMILEAQPSARLLIAGDGPMAAEIAGLIADVGVGDAVSLLGQVDDVPALLAAADVFVAPGWAESFPYANLEAMSARLPIVAADSGGVGEAIIDRSTGRLIPARDPKALAAAVTDVLSDPETAASYGEAARNLLEQKFTFDSMVEGTLGVYRELRVG